MNSKRQRELYAQTMGEQALARQDQARRAECTCGGRTAHAHTCPAAATALREGRR